MFFLVVLLSLALITRQQSPTTNTPVPPLQWIELTPLLSGSPPPGLKDASIGYDETSRTLVIFGGESNGFAQQQTYLLDLNALRWFPPSPPTGLDQKPPARSAAISGGDFAASNRHGHVVIGGKGSDGKGLSDAWEFDYINHFWSQISISPGGPSPRWGSAGGTDSFASPVQDSVVQGPNNTFYLAGGFDGTNAEPLSDAWQFQVAGVLAPNFRAVVGSWIQVPFSPPAPTKVRVGGVVMPSARVVAVGGCDSTNDFTDPNCASQDSFVFNFNSSTDIGPMGCPAPRVGPAVVPNLNPLTANYASQALVTLGTFNDQLWDDGGGLNNGEVDVLDIETGTWTRLLPAGDPGTTGTQRFPVPREGAAAISYQLSLVGSARTISSDTIIFGGKTSNGTYMQDVWLLRAYVGTVSGNNQTWPGFGDGQLQTGTNATGTGVVMQYLNSCATQKSSPTTPGAPSPSSPPGSTSPPSTNPRPENAFDTGVVHKTLSAVSIALLLGGMSAYRFSSPPLPSPITNGWYYTFRLTAIAFIIASYGTGIAGIISAFMSIQSNPSAVRRRSSSDLPFLPTSHSKAGLALFICLYGVVPVLFAISWCLGRPQTVFADEDARQRKNSNESGATGEKLTSNAGYSTRPALSHSDPSLPLPNERPVETGGTTRSWGVPWSTFKSKERSDARADSPGLESNVAGASQGFEVLNRPPRGKRMSGNGLASAGGSDTSHHGHFVFKSLSELNWLDRRRSVNAFGELDYAMSQLHASNHGHMGSMAVPPTPGTDLLSATTPLMESQFESQPELPALLDCLIHLFLQAAILAISAFSLAALWLRAPRATFIIFLLWVLAFYGVMLSLAWRGQPRRSVLSVLLYGLHAHPSNGKAALKATHPHIVRGSTPPPSRPLSTMQTEDHLGYLFPGTSDGRGPYTHHQPQYRRAQSSVFGDVSSADHAVDDDEDDDVQRRIEQEIERRDVSIVTVPKRRLWITNPSPLS